MKTVIHINRAVIARNTREGRTDPPLTVKDYRQNRKGHEVVLRDPFTGVELLRVKHRPHHPLACGARVWIETHLPVEVVEALQDAPDGSHP